MAITVTTVSSRIRRVGNRSPFRCGLDGQGSGRGSPRKRECDSGPIRDSPCRSRNHHSITTKTVGKVGNARAAKLPVMKQADIDRIVDTLRDALTEEPEDGWKEHVENAMNEAWDALLDLEKQ
jgi:hypothetical protein